MMHTDVEECHLAQRTGASIFLQAMKEGKVHLAHFILVALGEAAANASLDSKVAAGRTLLMCASMLPRVNERACFMQLLLGRGADVHRRDGAGRTALSLASEHGYLDAVRLLVFHGAHPDTQDNKGRSPLDYAFEGRHDDVSRFLSKVQAGLGETEAQTRVADGQQVVETFVNGLRHPPCQRTGSDSLLVDQVICNPYALDKKEEKILQHDYRKPSIPGNTVPPLHPLTSLCDQIMENPILCSAEENASTEQISKLNQMGSWVNSRSGFLPAWMKKSSAYPSKSLFTESASNKASSNFSKRMGSKMALSSSSSLRDSQTNLLIPEGEVMESSSNKSSQDVSVRKLQNTLKDTVLQNRCFLEEGSQWIAETTEGFPKNFEKWGYTEKPHPNHIKWSKLPRDKYLSGMRNAVHFLSQSEQNSAFTRSGCNVFKALRGRAHLERRFLHTRQLDPEQEVLVREEHTVSSGFLE